MDDDALRALFGEVRGVVDEWAVFAPVDTGDGTLWRGIRAWPWRPGDEGWLLLRHGRWQGLRPVFGVPLPTLIEALDGRPLPDELMASLMVDRRAALAASTFIGFDGHLWAGTEPRQNDDDTIFRLDIDSPTSDSTDLTKLLAGLWPDEARDAAVRREELELLPSTMLRRWTTVDILGDRSRTGADRRTRQTLSLVPPRHIQYKRGALWDAYRLLRPPRWLEGPTWPWSPRRPKR